MSDLSQTIEAGTILTIETGAYSDLSWSTVRVVKTFVKQDVVDAFLADQDIVDPGENDFLPWLTKAGYVEDIDKAHAWHVGAYSEFKP